MAEQEHKSTPRRHPTPGSFLHRTPSVGSVTKKIVTLCPHLNTDEVIQIVRQSIRIQGSEHGEFSGIEVIDEEFAIRIASEKAKNRN